MTPITKKNLYNFSLFALGCSGTGIIQCRKRRTKISYIFRTEWVSKLMKPTEPTFPYVLKSPAKGLHSDI